jgi:calcineurin-like phosphoesterase family protein
MNQFKRWVTADPHFFHHNIIAYCNRPFKNVEHMNRILIRNWNEVVMPEDHVYVVGDFSLKGPAHRDALESIVSRLNGTKHLILGNHDRLRAQDYQEIGFFSVHTSMVWNVHSSLHNVTSKVYMVHDPCSAQIPGSLWLCGHVHNLWDTFYNKDLDITVYNVGVDVHNFTPIDLDAVVEELLPDFKIS